jgi:hypothetical protein
MKIIEAITRIDAVKPNTYSQSEKIARLSRLDAMVKKNIIETHEGGAVEFTGYTEDTDLNTALIIPEPYDEAYLRWMEAQIDYYNCEYDKYNNAVDSFNAVYEDYRNYYNRTHMPKGKKFKFF